MGDGIDLGIDNIDEVTEIGRGGFSVVYAATNTLLSTRVAVKVLGRLSSDDDRRRFERECQVMGRLSHHASVVTVQHAGYTTDESPYLVMELVQGGSLADRIDAGPVPWPEAIDLIVPIADALAYVHEAGILHRDVKPENILLGDGGRPLLTDFGIARLGDATNTGTGIAASWLHAPPETFDNKRVPRSDLYSLASTLYQTITGLPPFWRSGEDTLNPLMYRLLNEPPPSLPPELAPAALADLLVRALAKSPDDRPADLAAFAAELRALRPAGPSSIDHRSLNTVAAFQPDAKAAAAAAPMWFTPPSGPPVFAPSGAAGAPSTDPSARTLAAGSPGSSGRRRGPLVAALVAVGLVVIGGLAYTLFQTGSGTENATATTATTTDEEPTAEAAPSTSASVTTTLEAADPVADTEAAEIGGRLALVQDRGVLNCGVNDSFPGFGEQLSDGSFAGFDIDFCRVIAAAVLGDAEAVDFIPVTAADRFDALLSGEIDVLSRNTSETATRTGEFGADFPFTTFFDGQGFMVGADSGITSIDDLSGATACVIAGTTTELNVEVESTSRGLGMSVLALEDNELLGEAYLAGQCDAWTSDVTVLSSFRNEFDAPGDHVILGEHITTEPLGLVVAGGDSQWSTAVEWAAMVTVQSWEAGIDSSNIGSYTGTDVTALLITGQNPFDPGFGLQPGYPQLVIGSVGNYEEIYQRNLADSGLEIEGSPNDLVVNGGQLFVPPLR